MLHITLSLKFLFNKCCFQLSFRFCSVKYEFFFICLRNEFRCNLISHFKFTSIYFAAELTEADKVSPLSVKAKEELQLVYCGSLRCCWFHRVLHSCQSYILVRLCSSFSLVFCKRDEVVRKEGREKYCWFMTSMLINVI